MVSALKNDLKLSYRLYQDEDLDGVLHLWDRHSGWGAITSKQFDEWHINTPYGPCLIVVAENEEKQIVGQIVFVPSIVYTNGKDHGAYRVMAPIVNSDIRGADIKDFNHPAYAMLRFGMEEAKKRNRLLIYFLPSVGWLSMFKTFPNYGLPHPLMCKFGCLRISLSEEQPLLVDASGKYYLKAGVYNEEYDELWKEAVISLPVLWAVKRNSAWLKWKRGGHLLFEMRERLTDKLSGYIVVKRETNLVVDILACSLLEMECLVKQVVLHLEADRSMQSSGSFAEIKMMQTPLMEKVLHAIPHDTIPYTFAFVCLSLCSKESLNEYDLFIMPDD